MRKTPKHRKTRNYRTQEANGAFKLMIRLHPTKRSLKERSQNIPYKQRLAAALSYSDFQPGV